MKTGTAKLGIKARQIADAHFDFASDFLGLSDSVKAYLRTPFRVVQVALPVTMDDGLLQLFAGCRIQHNDLHTPIMGGIRYHPAVDESELAALAETTTWKAALVRIPVGGAMGGVRCDPQSLSKAELRRLTQKYFARMHRILGPHEDVPAPDMNTNSEVMAWILQEYADRYGHSFACVTGKPGYLGGLMDPHKAANRGAIFVLSKHLNGLGRSLKGMKIAIQGFGNMGSNLALMLCEQKCEIVAVSDIYSGIVSRDGAGLSIADLITYVEENGSISHFPGARTVDREEIISCDCDILIPAAMECTLTEENAGKIKAWIVAEAANLPISYEADELLEQKGITVLPDILVNAGGVISSYLEWMHNRGADTRNHRNPDLELCTRLEGAYADVMSRAVTEGISIKKAAYTIALERVSAEEAKHNQWRSRAVWTGGGQ
jgi:glutamate dehydrogenase (NAD(P)+)